MLSNAFHFVCFVFVLVGSAWPFNVGMRCIVDEQWSGGPPESHTWHFRLKTPAPDCQHPTHPQHMSDPSPCPNTFGWLVLSPSNVYVSPVFLPVLTAWSNRSWWFPALSSQPPRWHCAIPSFVSTTAHAQCVLSMVHILSCITSLNPGS